MIVSKAEVVDLPGKKKKTKKNPLIQRKRSRYDKVVHKKLMDVSFKNFANDRKDRNWAIV